MLTIRLQKVGRKHEPVFRLVLTDSKNSTKSGRSIEILGNYDPRSNEKVVLKEDRIKHWLGYGAGMSDTVHNILVDKKIVESKKINKLPKKRPILSATIAENKEVVEEQKPEQKEVSLQPETASS